MADEPCIGCGATSLGVFVCHACGVPVRSLVDPDEQRRALDELHGRLAAFLLSVVAAIVLSSYCACG
jgi:hypothetical protein